MSNARKAREITNKDEIDYFVNLTEEECLKYSFIVNTFGEIGGKRKYNTYDIITIPAGSYNLGQKKNTKPFRTTVGLWVFNKAMIEKDLSKIIGYVNKPITKKMYGKINEKLSYALLEDDITTEQLKRYLLKTQKFQSYSTILSANFSLEMLTCDSKIEKKKKELYKKYEKDIKAGNLDMAIKMENELLDYAKEILKDDPSLDLYDSEAAISYGNNFKNMYVMKGAMKDPDPTKGYNVALSNYSSGFSKEEYGMLANNLAAGPYARGKKTANGGYLEKLLLSALQHLVLDKPGSDCGSKRFVVVKLTDKNIVDWMYSYIIEGSKLIELTSKNKDTYIGKTVKFRFSSLCENPNICNKCAGNLFYRLGVKNVGSATPQVASRLKNISMKAFHDSVATVTEMDPMKAFGID